MRRAFPVVYVRDVDRALAFYRDLLGFEEQYRFPPEGETAYVGLRREAADLGLAHESSPQALIGQGIGEGLRFELFVYVDDVDETLARARAAGVHVLREAQDMPWGERMGIVADPDGNPVTLAAPAATRPPG